MVFILFIIIILLVAALFLIKSENAKYQDKNLDIRNRKADDFDEMIYEYTVDVTKSEYNKRRQPIYKWDKNGNETKHHTAEFTKSVNSNYSDILSKLKTDNELNAEFVKYIEFFYPESSIKDFHDILEEFLEHPQDYPDVTLDDIPDDSDDEDEIEDEPVPENNTKTLTTTQAEVVQKVLSRKPSNIISNKQTSHSNNPPVDELMLHSKFVRFTNADKFRTSFKKCYGFNELSGIYLIYNASKRKWLVGQSQKAISRCVQHFESINDSIPDIRRDWSNGDVMLVNFIRLKDTNFNTLDELEYEYINKYDCVTPKGYNKTHGSKTNH